MDDTTAPTAKESWVEPEIRTLDVSQTKQNHISGGDGGNYADCTRS